MAPMGCLPGDFNEDGLQDVLAYYWGRTPVAFIKRHGTSSALNTDSYTRSEVVQGGARWYTNAATLADIDGDGHTDLIIGNFFPDGARILDARAKVGDEMQDSMSFAQNGGHKHLLLWKAPATGTPPSTVQFEEAHGALDEQNARGWALAIGAADLDGDLLPEIYFANDFGPDRLLHNRSTPGHPRFELLEGRRSFTTTKSKVLGRDSYKGMGVDFGDLNGDGEREVVIKHTNNWDVDPSPKFWKESKDTYKITAFLKNGTPLWTIDLGWGIEAGVFYSPMVIWDIDGDGRAEVIAYAARRERPSPLDEVRSALAVFEENVWDALPQFCRSLDRTLRQSTGRGLPLDAAPIRFGSWIGGDRDGNPFVTPEVTRSACLMARWTGLSLYAKDPDGLEFELFWTVPGAESIGTRPLDLEAELAKRGLPVG